MKTSTVLYSTAVVAAVASLGRLVYSQTTSHPASSLTARSGDGHLAQRPSTKTGIVDPEAYRREIEATRPTSALLRVAWTSLDSGDPKTAETFARKASNASDSPTLKEEAERILGRALADQARYRESIDVLETYRETQRNDLSVNLTTALCYLKTGDREKALALYPESSVLRYRGNDRRDLPSISSSDGLEASILIARGIDDYYRASGGRSAIRDFEKAYKLAPRNPVAAMYTARTMIESHREREALPYLAVVVQKAKGGIRSEAAQRFSRFTPAAQKQALRATGR